MKDSIAIAQQTFLQPAGFVTRDLEKLLGSVMKPNIDFADIYFQSTRSESWVLEQGIVKEGNFSIDTGVGVRAVSHDKTGHAYSDDINLQSLSNAAKAAAAISRAGQTKSINVNQSSQNTVTLYSGVNPIDSLAMNQKVAILTQIDKIARAADSRVKEVFASLSGVYEIIYILASDGVLSADIRPLVRLNVQVIVEENGRREVGSAGGGGRFSYQHFIEHGLIEKYTKEALRQALVNLSSVPAPAGTMPVVLGPGWPAVLLHEAVGHGLEGDFNRKGSSAFSNLMGKKIATEHCTVVDDGTLEHRRGSLNIDDEGTPSQCTTLIENGKLCNYMQDKLNAKLMGSQSTGNGRRESYASLPIPRMTNTYLLPGSYHPEEIIASVKKGIYAVNFGGGQVDITSGQFVFSANEAYLIERGKITKPIKGATLIGNGPDVLQKISMVGNDLALDKGVGVCGKDGQSVPVGVGQPTLKVNELTVGGTNG